MKRKINFNKPAFLQGGKITPGDITVRNAAGYPVGPDGAIDMAAMKTESMRYYQRLHSAHGSDKATNCTPPKKKRK